MPVIGPHRPHRGGLVPYLKFLAVTLAVAALEIIGGLATGSLSLISDAVGHAPIHLAAGGLAMVSYLMASRRTDALNHRRETWVRVTIAALIALGAVGIGWEAVERLLHPHAVKGWWVFGLAILGLLGNRYQARLLGECDCEPDLALRSDVRSDSIMSIAVALAGAAIGLGGSVIIDPALSLAAVAWISVIAILLFLGKHAHERS